MVVNATFSAREIDIIVAVSSRTVQLFHPETVTIVSVTTRSRDFVYRHVIFASDNTDGTACEPQS